MTLEELLRIHPWPPEYLAKGRPLDWIEHFHVKAPRAELWPVLMDTSRFNRFMGLPEMKYEERGGFMYGSARNAGILQEWKEIPWSWTSESSMSNAREYSRGIGYFLRAVYILEPAQDGTDVTIYFGWIPRNPFMRLLLALGKSSFWKGYQKALSEIEKMLKEKEKSPEPLLALKRPVEAAAGAQTRIQEAGARLVKQGIGQNVFDRLAEHILTGDDLDLYRIRPLALASQWDMPQKDVMRLCLYAAKEGILTMSWDVICPHCRGVRQEAGTLGDLPRKSSCDACEIEFENNSEESIEITFHVHPSIRSVPRVFFCSAEPARKTHIKLQQYLRAGAEFPAQIPLEEGRYRLRMQGTGAAGSLVVKRDAPAADLVWEAGGAPVKAEAGPLVQLRLVNRSDRPQTFTLERNDWDKGILKPAMLFNLQEFHDLFSAEYISLDLQLELGEQTILFTDMVGSTRFYAQAGDSKAFALVKRHFEEVYASVRDGGGAVIKTIGDAVMAAFSDPLDAVKTAVSLQKSFHGVREDSPIRLRVSVHTGPCIGVNLNSGIDYFGTTVNVAAKLQAQAGAQQVVLSDRLFQAPGIAAWLGSSNFDLSPVRQPVDGVGEVAAYRFTVQ